MQDDSRVLRRNVSEEKNIIDESWNIDNSEESCFMLSSLNNGEDSIVVSDA